jgi:hypothetical protein
MSLPGSDVFHAGEIAVQERAGERTVAVRRATMICDRLDDGMRAAGSSLVAFAAGKLGSDLKSDTPKAGDRCRWNARRTVPTPGK